MRIFITGGNGQLAKSIGELYGKSEDIYYASKNTLDITNRSDVLAQVKSFRPNIIFHFASMTRGDECAKNPVLAKKINVGGTKNIVAACKKYGSALLFVSTNEVFDGKKRSPYNENDTPNPITVVGETKLQAENVIRENMSDFYIIRTSWLYSDWSSNFIHAVLKKAIKDKEIELVDDEIGSPTYSLDLARAIQKLIQTDQFGTYHVANEGVVSRLEFAKKAFKIYKMKNIKIIPVNLSHFNRLSKPPLYSALKNTKTKKIGIEMPIWDDALKRFLSENNLLKTIQST